MSVCGSSEAVAICDKFGKANGIRDGVVCVTYIVYVMVECSYVMEGYCSANVSEAVTGVGDGSGVAAVFLA